MRKVLSVLGGVVCGISIRDPFYEPRDVCTCTTACMYVCMYACVYVYVCTQNVLFGDMLRRGDDNLGDDARSTRRFV